MTIKDLTAILLVVLTLIASQLIYPTTLVITELDYDTNTVYLETSTGIAYCMTGCEDYVIGDLVSVLMFSNNTEYISDDTILSARYSGWFITPEGEPL